MKDAMNRLLKIEEKSTLITLITPSQLMFPSVEEEMYSHCPFKVPRSIH